jgi:hypothetical protein
VRGTDAGTREIRHFGREPGHARRRAARTALLGRGTTLARPLALPAPLGLTTDGSFTLLIPRGLRHPSPRCGCEVGERRLPADAAVADGLPLICPPPREGRRFGPRDHAPPLAINGSPARYEVGGSLLAPSRGAARQAEAGGVSTGGRCVLGW